MKKIITFLNNSLEIKEELLVKIQTEDELLSLLARYIQELIDSDFQYFLWILYKIDVNENKVKETIKQNPQNSSEIIAQLILERVKEKIITREKYKSEDDGKDGDWIFM